ncbi:hypothetical protein D3C73_722160 [compost metagenome]
MAHDHDIPNFQHLNGIFERRRRAMELAVRLIGRHHVGNVANHEKLTRTAVENRFRRSAGIATGNQKRVRLLSVFGKNTVTLALVRIASAHEVAVARKQFGWEIGHEGYEYYAFEPRSTARYAQSGASLALAP